MRNGLGACPKRSMRAGCETDATREAQADECMRKRVLAWMHEKSASVLWVYRDRKAGAMVRMNGSGKHKTMGKDADTQKDSKTRRVQYA